MATRLEVQAAVTALKAAKDELEVAKDLWGAVLVQKSMLEAELQRTHDLVNAARAELIRLVEELTD
jgi:tRNA threonylcarbamoyladenosine modification (KEOPS) complex Cgi121 subunit